MKQDLEVAVIFSRRYIKECDIIVLVPQKVVIGKCTKNSQFFVNNVDNQKIENIDEANYKNKKYGFYYATKINELQKKYETTNLDVLLQKYMDDICMKVHYYTKFDDNNFESYLLKNSSIDEFNKKYNVNFKYKFQEKESTEILEKSNLKSSTEIDDKVAQDILNIKKKLDSYISFQDKAIEKLLKTVYNNYIIGTGYNNILISGPDGVGKTTALNILAEYSNHPIVYCSIKREFSDEERDVYEIFDTLLSNLYYDAINNKKLNSNSIIILDDFDKLNDDESFEIQMQLLNFLQQRRTIVSTPKKIIFDANKITFIICGNFNRINKVIDIPEEFFMHDNYQIDEENLILNQKELVNHCMFLEHLLPYFQEQVLFDELNLEKTKEIIKIRNNKILKAYFHQLEKQGVKNVVLDSEAIDALASHIYSQKNNLKDFDKIIANVFKDIIFDSLTYYGKESELYINKHILQKNEKGYQFTLKNKKDML